MSLLNHLNHQVVSFPSTCSLFLLFDICLELSVGEGTYPVGKVVICLFVFEFLGLVISQVSGIEINAP